MSKLKQILVYRGFHRLINTRSSSRWFGSFANAKLYPPLLQFLIRIYVRLFGIDLSEYILDIYTVKTFNAFFTRHLKPNTRIWEKGISSPVDGTLLSYGTIENDSLFQVKGMFFSQSELTGRPVLENGSFVNLYLSPADYHRVHAPFNLQIDQVSYFPGNLLSVSRKNAESVPGLYVNNERVVLSGTSDYGKFHFVFVGALNVGSIRLSHFPAFRTNTRVKLSAPELTSPLTVKKGEELGWFEMGSTIIILIEQAVFSRIALDKPVQKVKLGQSLLDLNR